MFGIGQKDLCHHRNGFGAVAISPRVLGLLEQLLGARDFGRAGREEGQVGEKRKQEQRRDGGRAHGVTKAEQACAVNVDDFSVESPRLLRDKRQGKRMQTRRPVNPDPHRSTRATIGARRPGAASLRPKLAALASMIFVLFQFCGTAAAQDTPEAKAFKVAVSAFEDGVFDRAERELGQFVSNYPASPMLPEAILLRARATSELGDQPAAISLLNSNLAKAGPLADQYYYRIGEAHYAGSNYLAAVDSFAALTRNFTNSGLILEAAYFEALARFKLRDFSRVVALLQNPNGPFQRAARVRPSDATTARGGLLLAEVLLEQRLHVEAEKTVLAIGEKDLLPDLKWDRQYLLCRVQLAEGRLPEALDGATNLVSLAIGAAKPELRADSTAFQAGLLRQLGQPDAAIQVFTNNLAEGVPADRRRLALLNIIELNLAQNRLEEAVRLLKEFLARHTVASATDMVLLTLGEVNLRLYLEGAATNGTDAATVAGGPAGISQSTNRLDEAISQFDKVLSSSTNSPIRAKAFLNKGWGLWLEGKPAESAAAFKAATELLPFSEEAAVARFKLADAQLRQGELTNALANYRLVGRDFSALPRVRAELVPRARFQIVSAASAAGDLTAAEEAMRQLLESQADGPLAERSLLLLGESLTDAKQSARARTIYAEFAERFPDSPLLADVQRARGRTYFEAGEWPATVRECELWLERFPTNELRPRVEAERVPGNRREPGLARDQPDVPGAAGRRPRRVQAPGVEGRRKPFHDPGQRPGALSAQHRRRSDVCAGRYAHRADRIRQPLGPLCPGEKGLRENSRPFWHQRTGARPAAPAGSVGAHRRLLPATGQPGSDAIRECHQRLPERADQQDGRCRAAQQGLVRHRPGIRVAGCRPAGERCDELFHGGVRALLRRRAGRRTARDDRDRPVLAEGSGPGRGAHRRGSAPVEDGHPHL